MALKDQVAAALRSVMDPSATAGVTSGHSAGQDIVSSGRAAGIVVKNEGTPEVSIGLVLSVDGIDKTAAERLQAAVEVAINRIAGNGAARIILTADRSNAPTAAARPVATTVPGIRKIIAVASGKGGVGKSTVAANLAMALARAGNAVGLLDADIYGPSVPTLLGISGRARLDDGKLQPVQVHGIKALSMGMMTDPEKAVIWRGPMASSAMLQMVEKADWGMLDVLVIDLPPGTGDIQLTMAQKLKPDGAVIVSTPQDLALIDARRAVAMFGEVGVPIIGVIENMSGYVCPHCGVSSDPFGHGGAETEATKMGVAFLGRIPLDIGLRKSSDAGQPATGANGAAFDAVAEAAATAVGL